MTEEQLHRLLEELVKQPMESMGRINLSRKWIEIRKEWNRCRKWVEIPEGWDLCRIAYKQ